MKLAAALVVRNEVTRYLKPCLDHLLDFCDDLVVLDDASDDGTREYLIDHPDQRVHVVTQSSPTFYIHEGRTRQLLLDATFDRAPDYVLSIDADEFVSNGNRLRTLLDEDPGERIWSLAMEEVWNATPDALQVRHDGGWRVHPLPFLWKTPGRLDGSWRMMDKKLSTRRVPIAVLREAARAKPTGESILHFGWTDPATRQRRYDRYAKHDGGRFHASSHLRSILWPDSKTTLKNRPWPDGPIFTELREHLVGVPA